MATETTKIRISDEVLEQYRAAATQWDSTLLDLPIAALDDLKPYMVGRSGVRGELMLAAINAKSQFGPYNPDRVTVSDIDIPVRTLVTHQGSVIEKFHPNDYAELLMGYKGAIVGDGQKVTDPALLVLSAIQKARGEALSYAVFNGKRNPEGETTADIFDGFNTIAKAEIAAGALNTDDKNLFEVEALTRANAVDILKNEVLFKANPFLRRQKTFLFCSHDVADKYNESFLQTHPSLIYNTQYNQVSLEGSNGLVTIVPLAQLEGSDLAYITPQNNMVWGTDNESDASFTQVDRLEPFRLTFSASMFFGVQFRSIDPRMLAVIKFANE